MIYMDSLLVAEYVRFNPDGTLNAFTIFDQISVASTPAVFGFYAVTHLLAMEGDREAGPHHASFGIYDPANREVARQNAIFVLPEPVAGDLATSWVVVHFSGVPISDLGLFRIEVTIDDRIEETKKLLFIPVVPGFTSPR